MNGSSSFGVRAGMSVSQPATPSMSRKVRMRHPSQSPRVPDDDKVKYRSPPREPFQPAFYRTPINDDAEKNSLKFTVTCTWQPWRKVEHGMQKMP